MRNGLSYSSSSSICFVKVIINTNVLQVDILASPLRVHVEIFAEYFDLELLVRAAPPRINEP